MLYNLKWVSQVGKYLLARRRSAVDDGFLCNPYDSAMLALRCSRVAMASRARCKRRTSYMYKHIRQYPIRDTMEGKQKCTLYESQILKR